MSDRSTTLHRLLTRTAITTLATGLSVVVFACSDRDVNLGFGVAGDAGGVFVAPVEDAGPEAEVGFTLYCPSSECPADRTTCPDSRFRCDVDLMTDRDNCGGCGLACPRETASEMFECVEGRCVMACTGVPTALDCDGVPDNGCEIKDLNDDHCGACGNKCSDPDKPCVYRALVGDIGCGCKPGQALCKTPFTRCVNATDDDENCGACGNACDPNGDGDAGVPHDTFYFGCYSGQCGHLKCMPTLANCDGDKSNGCETSVLTAENCGGCGVACAPGQDCRLDDYGSPQCMCPAGETFCPTWCFDGICSGACFNLASDRNHCGACGSSCAPSGSINSIGTCTYGMCNRQCMKGWADCNGNETDQCETNIDSDPMNCGGCGKVCDAVAGQACVGGSCVVEPCDSPARDAGPVEVPQ